MPPDPPNTFLYFFSDMFDWYQQHMDARPVDAASPPTLFDATPDVCIYHIRPSYKYEPLRGRDVRAIPDPQARRAAQQRAKKAKKAKTAADPDRLSHDMVLAPFLKQHITRVARILFLTPDPALYPNGLFAALNLRNREMYLVFPTEKEAVHTGARVLVADHFTLCLDAVTQRIPLHLTLYTPNPFNETEGSSINALRNPFDDGVALPLEGYDTSVFRNMQMYAPTLLDACRAHAMPPGWPPSALAAAAPASGGGRVVRRRAGASTRTRTRAARRVRLQRPRRPEPPSPPRYRPPRATRLSAPLARALHRHRIAHLRLFCVRHPTDGTWHLSSFAQRTRRPAAPPGGQQQDDREMACRLPDASWKTVQAAVLRALTAMD
jgi:hypothetical protein